MNDTEDDKSNKFVAFLFQQFSKLIENLIQFNRIQFNSANVLYQSLFVENIRRTENACNSK